MGNLSANSPANTEKRKQESVRHECERELAVMQEKVDTVEEKFIDKVRALESEIMVL